MQGTSVILVYEDFSLFVSAQYAFYFLSYLASEFFDLKTDTPAYMCRYMLSP
uniref:Uncharacterized protein n=1 Tax=Rhizophora mucronata TaxID=61149 RepID=A0A2P2MS32_RHIMU